MKMTIDGHNTMSGINSLKAKILNNNKDIEIWRNAARKTEKENIGIQTQIEAIERSKVDLSKLPKDTLVAVRGSSAGNEIIRHFSHVSDKLYTYSNGSTSMTSSAPTRAHHWKQIRILENKPQMWFGGKCPVPNGIEIKYWLRNGNSFNTINAIHLDWEHHVNRNDGDIIGLQLLESEVWHTLEGER